MPLKTEKREQPQQRHGKQATPKPCFYLDKGGFCDGTAYVDVRGGGPTITHVYTGKDFTATFFTTSTTAIAHTAAAVHMLLQCRLGYVKRVARRQDGQLGEYANYMMEKLTAYPCITEERII